jgi:hypothetical protein
MASPEASRHQSVEYTQGVVPVDLMTGQKTKELPTNGNIMPPPSPIPNALPILPTGSLRGLGWVGRVTTRDAELSLRAENMGTYLTRYSINFTFSLKDWQVGV